MDKFSELKAAAMAATPGRIGDRIDGSGSIKYECTGYDGSLVLRTDHKDMEYGFVGDNADSDELFFRLCVPDVVLELLAELEAKDKRIAELERANTSQDDHINQQQDRIDSLEKTNAGLGRRLGEAEKLLATPVRFPDCDIAAVSHMAHWLSDEEAKAWVKGVEFAKQQVLAAGFTVEGDA